MARESWSPPLEDFKVSWCPCPGQEQLFCWVGSSLQFCGTYVTAPGLRGSVAPGACSCLSGSKSRVGQKAPLLLHHIKCSLARSQGLGNDSRNFQVREIWFSSIILEKSKHVRITETGKDVKEEPIYLCRGIFELFLWCLKFSKIHTFEIFFCTDFRYLRGNAPFHSIVLVASQQS
jgi:hypothetical protein